METIKKNITAFVGIDWADQKHDISLCSASGEKPEHVSVDHTPEALSEWFNKLRQRFPDGYIAVCLEQSKGSLLFHLMGYDFLILYPVNPKALARYREAFNTSGAKDDRPDADFLRELIYQHRDRLRPWVPEDECSRSISFLTEARRKAVDERTRLTNRLLSTLKTYFPQALKLTGANLYDKMSLAFLQRWETLKDIQHTRDKTIRSFYTKHGSRSAQIIDDRLALIRSTTPLTTDKAVITSAVITVRMLIRQLSALNASIEEYEKTLNDLYMQHPDKDIFDSFPGAGSALAPRLVAAWGSDRNRYEDAEDMQKYCGVAPVTIRSGRTHIVQRRRACPKFLLQTFIEFSRCSLLSCTWAKAYYDMQRDRGKDHHETIRSLAFKWIRIIYSCWKRKVCYSEIKYLNSLQRSRSPLLSYMTASPSIQ